MAIPWNGLGAPPWGCHGMLLGLSHVDPPMAIPWNGIGTSHGRGFHGMLLWVGPGDPTQWPFHGMALGLLMGGPHGMPLWVAHGGHPMVLYV